MCLINDDVLRHVLCFMSAKDIHRINGTNRLFFEASMVHRYTILEITKRDNSTRELLKHICESEDVGQYVKMVKIRPWLLQPHTNSSQSITEKVMVRFMEFVVDPDYAKKKAEAKLQKRLQKDTARITTAFKTMKTLQELEIDWDDTRGFHPELFRAFLAPLASWQDHLTSLTVKVPLPLASTLSSIRLPKLEIFVFHFTTGVLMEPAVNYAHDGFLVFVNNLKDSLQSLTFTSTHASQHLNLCHIFDHMGVFPSLRKMSLSIPFEGGHLPKPVSFVQFVMKHRQTLNHIDLFTSRCVARWTPIDPDCPNWIQNILSSFSEPLPRLRGFGVALRPLRTPLDVVADFLCMHPDIERLLLEDRVLGTAHIGQLFPRFIHQSVVDILHFQVKVDALTPDLIAYFAFKFPNLRTLKIQCSKVSLNNTGFYNYRSQTQSNDFFDSLSPLRQRRIEGWGLRSFVINTSPAANLLEAWFATHLPRAKVGYYFTGI